MLVGLRKYTQGCSIAIEGNNKLKSKPYSFTSYRVFIFLITIYMLTTLSYNLWPISTPNRVVGFFIFADVLWMVASQKGINKHQITILLLSSLICLITFAFASNYSRNLTDAIYWLTTMLLFSMVVKKENRDRLIEEIWRQKTFIIVILTICSILLVVGLFDGRCYARSWGGRYYTGYTVSEHTLCSGCCMVMAFILFFMKRRKHKTYDFAFFLPTAAAIMASGARIFMIPLVFVFAIYYIYYIKSFSWKILLAPVVVLTAVYFFLRSGMASKFLFVQGNTYISNTVAGQLTSGRVDFWRIDIKAYIDLPIIKKIFGAGFDYVYSVNRASYGMNIWAHNDIIDLLLSGGLIGVCLYMFEVGHFIKTLNRQFHRTLVRIIFSSYIMMPLILNGFFGYQHYLYSTVIFILAICELEDGRKNGEKS